MFELLIEMHPLGEPQVFFLANSYIWYNLFEFLPKITQLTTTWYKFFAKISICHVYSETNHSTISLACDNGLYSYFFSDCYTHSFACVDMPLTLLLLLTSEDLDSVPCSATKFSVGMGKSLSEEVTFTSPVDSHGT